MRILIDFSQKMMESAQQLMERGVPGRAYGGARWNWGFDFDVKVRRLNERVIERERERERERESERLIHTYL
jgi:hypothetical protein